MSQNTFCLINALVSGFLCREAANAFYNPMFKLERVAFEKFLGLFNTHRDAVNVKIMVFDKTIFFTNERFTAQA